MPILFRRESLAQRVGTSGLYSFFFPFFFYLSLYRILIRTRPEPLPSGRSTYRYTGGMFDIFIQYITPSYLSLHLLSNCHTASTRCLRLLAISFPRSSRGASIEFQTKFKLRLIWLATDKRCRGLFRAFTHQFLSLIPFFCRILHQYRERYIIWNMGLYCRRA